MPNSSLPSTTPQQLGFNLQIAVEREIDGIGMGVLTDGTPYLNIRGLADMCGVDHSMIVRITSDWIAQPLKPREMKIREMVRQQGADDRVAFMAVNKSGTIHHIIPSAVCMAILEYYAFEARTGNEKASQSYRLLARKGFHDFVYAQVGYNPAGSPNVAWQQFHDRVSLSYHTVPDGYFSIFREIADMFVTMIRGGAKLGKDFIPDISVGLAWGKFWKSENLEILYGERIKYNHFYPDYFPQSLSNPQSAYCYPDEALGEFRKWVREVYVQTNMPKYLQTKVRDGGLAAIEATAAITALQAPRQQPKLN